MSEQVIYVRLQDVFLKEGEALATFYYPMKDEEICINLSDQARAEKLNVTSEQIVKHVKGYSETRSNLKLVLEANRYSLKKFQHILEK